MANVNSVIIEGTVSRVYMEKRAAVVILEYHSAENFEMNGEGVKTSIKVKTTQEQFARERLEPGLGLRVVGRLDGLEIKYISGEYLELRPGLNE